MICFDDIDSWASELAERLMPLAPTGMEQRLRDINPKYVEDARDIFLEYAGRERVIDAMLLWIRSTTIAGYHGTRLTVADVDSIRNNGLIPLIAMSRRARLVRALSCHPRWNEVAGQIDAAIHSVGPGCLIGDREGQVHLTLCRAGLTDSFNHYLTHGAEFDWHVAQKLLGEEGKELLTRDGIPYVIQVAVPGEAAIAAAHPYFTVDDIRAKGDVPNMIDEFLKAWCFRLARPSFESRTLKFDCGMVFESAVPPDWIQRIDPWATK